MNRVALSVIIGDGQDEQKWEDLLASVDGFVDKIFVGYNGNQEEFPYHKSWNTEVEHFEWTDDFAEARNNAFGMIPRGAYDWILWMDADDTLVNAESMPDMLERATDDGLHQIFLPYIYASDEDGTPRVTQWRERILSTRVPWKWYFRIHEVCHTQPGSKVANYDDVIILHHRDEDPFTHKVTRERNRRILGKAMQDSPDEPRYIYYQANETFAEAYFLYEQKDNDCMPYFKEAIKLYQKFGRTNPSSDDAYAANFRIGDALRMVGDWPKAIDIAMQGIKIRPRWAQSWMLAVHAMYGMREFDAAVEFATIALEICKEPVTNQISEPMTLLYTPYALRALSLMELGKFDEAIVDYDIALAYWNNPNLAAKKQECIERRDGIEAKGASKVRKKLLGSKPTRSIAFLTRPLPEVWNAKTLAEGSGGTEWCVHEVARRFRADGFRSVIFGTPGDERGVDSEGVEWWDSNDYDANEEFAHVVAVRAPEVFDTPLAARKSKTLWLHDVNMGPDIQNSPWGNRFDKPDNIVCLTNWHSNREQRLYGVNPKKIKVIGNGINLEDYPEWTADRVHGKFIYASSPDRGIDTLLQMWPAIKTAIPEASLDIYYGWNMLDKIVAMSGGQHPLANYKAGVVQLYEAVQHLDVNWHNRVSRPELQKIETSCDMWLYPTHFLETFCITALEMKMNGVIPLVNPIGALQEVVPCPDYHVYGMPNHPDYWKKYVEELVHLHGTSSMDEREGNRDWASQFTWDSRYDSWRNMLNVTSKKVVTHGK